MNKEFIPYEQALELKQLGFDEECLGYYTEYNDGSAILYTASSDFRSLEAPLYQQAFRFFREKYLLHHEVNCGSNVFWFNYGSNGIIVNLNTDTNNDSYYSTYEKAEHACLLKLIELAKQK